MDKGTRITVSLADRMRHDALTSGGTEHRTEAEVAMFSHGVEVMCSLLLAEIEHCPDATIATLRTDLAAAPERERCLREVLEPFVNTPSPQLCRCGTCAVCVARAALATQETKR